MRQQDGMLDITTVKTDPNHTFILIEHIYRAQLTNAIYCLTGNSQITEEIFLEICGRVVAALGDSGRDQLQCLNLKQFVCKIALNVVNTWLGLHYGDMQDTQKTAYLSY